MNVVDTGNRNAEQTHQFVLPSVPEQLDGLRSIEDGWYEGEGFAPPHAGLDWLLASFERYYPDDASLPHVYPTFEGGVRMEWSYLNNAIILEIDLSSHCGEWLWFDRNSDAEQERELDLNYDSAWAWLVAEIRSKAASGV